MQRKSFVKLLLTGLGYMVLGNIMATILTAALAVMIDSLIVQIIAFIITLFIFYSLIFLPGYKDGIRERMMEKNKRTNGPIKNRWINIGLCLTVIMWIPSIILILDKLLVWFKSYLITYRIICGAVYPFLLSVGVNTADIDNMPLYIPFVVMGIYAFIPLAAHFGFKSGYEDRFNPDKVMYEKKK